MFVRDRKSSCWWRHAWADLELPRGLTKCGPVCLVIDLVPCAIALTLERHKPEKLFHLEIRAVLARINPGVMQIVQMGTMETKTVFTANLKPCHGRLWRWCDVHLLNVRKWNTLKWPLVSLFNEHLLVVFQLHRLGWQTKNSFSLSAFTVHVANRKFHSKTILALRSWTTYMNSKMQIVVHTKNAVLEFCSDVQSSTIRDPNLGCFTST